MKTLLIALLMGMAQLAQASTLYVTCGNGAYEALEGNMNLGLAEFSLVLLTKGPNTDPKVINMTDDGNDLTDRIRLTQFSAKGGVFDLKINMKNHDLFEITSLTGCTDIDEATGDISFKRHLGKGFNPYAPAVRAKCSCLKK